MAEFPNPEEAPTYTEHFAEADLDRVPPQECPTCHGRGFTQANNCALPCLDCQPPAEGHPQEEVEAIAEAIWAAISLDPDQPADRRYEDVARAAIAALDELRNSSSPEGTAAGFPQDEARVNVDAPSGDTPLLSEEEARAILAATSFGQPPGGDPPLDSALAKVRGFLTCPACHGGGEVGSRGMSINPGTGTPVPDPQMDETHECSACRGTGLLDRAGR